MFNCINRLDSPRSNSAKLGHSVISARREFLTRMVRGERKRETETERERETERYREKRVV